MSITGFTEAAPANSAYRKVQEVFIKKVWEFEAGGRTLPADNHEWPFELALPGTTPESIEGKSEPPNALTHSRWSEEGHTDSVLGLVNSWIVYRLKATIERGLMQQNILERKHLRVIRTLNPSVSIPRNLYVFFPVSFHDGGLDLMIRLMP